MAERIAYFETEEGVSRANFNSRIEQINTALESAEAEKGVAGGVATLNSSGKVSASQASAEIVKHLDVTAYTLTAADMGKYHEFGVSGTSAATLTITVPNSSSIPVGSEIEITKTSSSLTVNIVGSGVTFYLKDVYNAASFTLDGKYGLIALKKRTATSWTARGDIK